MNDTLFSSYHLSDKNVPYYIAEMERLKPKFIDSYPSSIFRIADFICRNGIRHAIRPTVVITSSETLLDYQREVIERTFSCPVRDQYGNAEMAAFVAQCNHGSYHVAPEYGLIEILSESGDSLPAGESGQLCLTSFLNPAMPLIRYLIGDVGRMATSRCPCGRMTQILDGLEGRQDDTIVTPSGRNVGRLDPAFKGVTGVRMSQILQVSLDQVIVKIIADSTEAVDQARLVENLQERLGNDVHISFSFVSEIEKEPNGKFRSVKSLIR
jgi:phenylacetate-CoA ligase